MRHKKEFKSKKVKFSGNDDTFIKFEKINNIWVKAQEWTIKKQISTFVYQPSIKNFGRMAYSNCQ